MLPVKVRTLEESKAKREAKPGEVFVVVLDAGIAKQRGVGRYAVARFDGREAQGVGSETYTGKPAAIEAARKEIERVAREEEARRPSPRLSMLLALYLAEQRMSPNTKRSPEMQELIDEGFAVPSLRGYAMTDAGRAHLADVRRQAKS